MAASWPDKTESQALQAALNFEKQKHERTLMVLSNVLARFRQYIEMMKQREIEQQTTVAHLQQQLEQMHSNRNRDQETPFCEICFVCGDDRKIWKHPNVNQCTLTALQQFASESFNVNDDDRDSVSLQCQIGEENECIKLTSQSVWCAVQCMVTQQQRNAITIFVSIGAKCRKNIMYPLPFERSDRIPVTARCDRHEPKHVEKESMHIKNAIVEYEGNIRTGFVCKFCGKYSDKLWNIQCHIKNKHAIKPYECSVCSRRFGQQWLLKRHRAIHSNERPFQCLHCKKTFVRKYNLKLHIHRCQHVVQ